MKKTLKVNKWEVITEEDFPMLIIEGRVFDYSFLDTIKLILGDKLIETEQEFWKFLFDEKKKADKDFFLNLAE